MTHIEPHAALGARSGDLPLLDEGPSAAGEGRQAWIILVMLAVAAAAYFLAASIRYHVFRAGGMDVGYFDQACYLISRGEPPFSSYQNVHVMADHAAVVLYAIAQLYRIYPSVHWLFLIQGVAMAAAAWPLWRLAREAGIAPKVARAIILAYLLYPVVVMSALRDFYPEVIAVPALAAMVLCARQRRLGWFIFWTALALSTKEAISFTVAATGLWLAFADRRKTFGLIAVVVAIAWYLFASKFMIPHFGRGREPNTASFFNYMGNTHGQVLRTMLLRPWVPLKFVASKGTLIYIAALLLPVIWGLSLRKMSPLLCTIPCAAINLLAIYSNFRNPFYHYSWPMVPFIFLAVISTVAAGRGWFKNARPILIWSIALVLAGLLLRAKEMNFAQAAGGAGNNDLPPALAMIDDDGGVLATFQTAAHLSHRHVVQFIFAPGSDPYLLMPAESAIDWVLMDFKEDSLQNIGPAGTDLLKKYQADPHFKLVYQSGQVYLFHRIAPGK